MSTSWVAAKIVHQIDWAEGLRSLRFDQRLEFVPGQFVNLSLDAEGERKKRSYSAASAPGQELELFLTRVEKGELSEPLFERNLGDSVWLETTPYGFLTLEHVPNFARDLWLLSTGTGLAPFLSMLRSGVLLPRFENVLVVNCARINQHLAYEDELAELAKVNDGRIHSLGMVTREAATGAHVQGRITDAIRDGLLERTFDVPFDPARSHFMLCGNPEMISDVIQLLSDRGMKRHRKRDPGHITIEKYW
jgi:ferredoxin/flavodoxin---NADP+ reductase